MAWWKKLLGIDDEDSHDVDYYREGLDLLKVGHYHDAITSFRLALRKNPGETAALQQIAIAQTRIGMTEEAMKTYRSVLDKAPDTAGAHYGLGFLLLREGRDTEEARRHLRTFLDSPPDGPDAAKHVSHARRTLAELSGEADGETGDASSPESERPVRQEPR